MYRLITLIFIMLCFVSCGIEEYYYLPQIPQSGETSIMNTEAEINIPKIDGNEYYYFSNYAIYYKIYLSNNSNIRVDTPNLFSSELRSDFNAIAPYADPSNMQASTAIDQLFNNRKYHELKFSGKDSAAMLPSSGGRLTIRFPTGSGIGDVPVATMGSNINIPLMRSITSQNTDPYFVNSEDLRSQASADVVGTGNYAYVSMYIVAVGFNASIFTNIFSKPTHINIFKFPDY